MANITKQFAELLGVELEEEFDTLCTWNGQEAECRYKITEKEGLVYYNEQFDAWYHADTDYRYILSGEYEIIKQPYKPRKGEEYWALDGFSRLTAGRYRWEDSLYDYIRLKSGLVFHTRAEAVEAIPRVYRELTGKEWAEDVTEN